MYFPWQLQLGPEWIALGVCATFVVLFLLWVVAPFLARSGREDVRRVILEQLWLAARRGLPLPAALDALARDVKRRADAPRRRWLLAVPPLAIGRWLLRRQLARDAEAIADVGAVLLEGDLAKALREAPRAFPSPLPEILGAAARRGALVEALSAVRDLGVTAERFRATVRSRLFYPLSVLFGVEVAGSFSLIFIMPKISETYEALALGSSPFFETLVAAQPFLLVLVPVFLAWAWLAAGALVPGGGVVARGFRRAVPPLARADALARTALLARTVAAFLRAGVPLGAALRSAGVAGFSEAALEAAAKRADEGGTLGEALGGADLIPRGPRALLAEGGTPEALDALAEAALAEHRAASDALARFVLPVAILAIGALVASLYWPPLLLSDAILKRYQ